MAEFTFNLDSLKAQAAKFESSLFANVKDADLIYKGDDYIAWDRTNAERLRRGLPSLTSIGYPRPPQDAPAGPVPEGSTVPNPQGTSSTFKVKGPPGLTAEQAFAIFKKQADTGSLVGFKPGDSLSAASQAADGLASAQAALQQAQGGVSGSLGSFTSALSGAGVDLATGRIASVDAAFASGGLSAGTSALTNVVGSIAPGLGDAGGALNGSLAGITPGLTAAVGPAVSSASGSLSALPGVGPGKPLSSAAIVPGSTAATSIQTINNAITNFPVTNPINTADFTKVSSSITGAGAVSGIGPMSKPEVNGVLAQAKNLTNQLFSDISNSKGLGAFGLSIGQLETAGYVKPGTKAKFDADFSQFSNTIKSPAIWTGKDGVKNATDLLANPGKQSQIQQDLMTKGVAGLGAVGIPVQNLSSQGIAGMSLNAAKDLPSAEAFVKGLPIPGDATGSVQASFNSAVRDGAFAVNLVNTKVPTEFKQQDIPVPKSDTVNRETLDAASTRVVGDPKVPVPDYGGTPANDRAIEYINKATPWINQYLNVYYRRLSELESKVTALQNQQTITQAEWDAVDSERESIKTFKNEEVLPKLKELATLWDSLTTRLRNTIISGSGSRYDLTGSLINKFDYAFNLAAELKQKIDALKTKIEGAKV